MSEAYTLRMGLVATAASFFNQQVTVGTACEIIAVWVLMLVGMVLVEITRRKAR